MFWNKLFFDKMAQMIIQKNKLVRIIRKKKSVRVMNMHILPNI